MPLDQDSATFRIKSSALEKDGVFLLAGRIDEKIGQPFKLSLDILVEKPIADFAKLIGKGVTVEMAFRDDVRYFHGLISHVADAGHVHEYVSYSLTAMPWFWFLGLNAHHRVFQEQTVPDIIKHIFKDLNQQSDFKESLSAIYPVREYCLQYRESDFDFISRVMEEEGIYYYFDHENGKHTLVLSDAHSAHSAFPGAVEVPYVDSPELRDGITEWKAEMMVTTGKVKLDHYNFETPKTDLEALKSHPKKTDMAEHEIYDYPGKYSKKPDGERYAKIRLEATQALHSRFSGQANFRGIATGCLFTLTDHAQGEGDYLVLDTDFDFSNPRPESKGDESVFNCNYAVIPSDVPYRSPLRTSKPKICGNQTAEVIGKEGEEIDIDKYGRIRARFHWGATGKGKEPTNTSCWVRVAQPWGGKGWGMHFWPRVGDEVLVSFLEGDPDQPLVTGSVYNADRMPLYGLPENKTRTGIKTKSSKKGTDDNFNELRFEDKKDEEEIYFHAEKDLNTVVENNETRKVGFDKADKGDQSIDIQNNQVLNIGDSKAADGSQTVAIWKDRTATLEKGDDKLVVKMGSQTVEISKDQKITVKTGDHVLKVSAGKSTMEATKAIELKCGGSSIKIEPAKISIKAPEVSIQGDAKIDAKSPLTTVKGDGMLTLKGGVTLIN